MRISMSQLVENNILFVFVYYVYQKISFFQKVKILAAILDF